jgi:hypothetical protein
MLGCGVLIYILDDWKGAKEIGSGAEEKFKTAN